MITSVMVETLHTLNPKLKLAKTLDDAEASVAKIEADLLKSLHDKVPQLSQFIQGSVNHSGDTNLNTIDEEPDDVNVSDFYLQCSEDV